MQKGVSEIGPFTIGQLNQMRPRNEIAGSDLCRSSDSTEFHPLAFVFPHMTDFVRKSREEHKREAQKIEGNSQANAGKCPNLKALFLTVHNQASSASICLTASCNAMASLVASFSVSSTGSPRLPFGDTAFM